MAGRWRATFKYKYIFLPSIFSIAIRTSRNGPWFHILLHNRLSHIDRGWASFFIKSKVARDLDKIETRKSLGLLGRLKIHRCTRRFTSGFVMREGALRFFPCCFSARTELLNDLYTFNRDKNSNQKIPTVSGCHLQAVF